MNRYPPPWSVCPSNLSPLVFVISQIASRLYTNVLWYLLYVFRGMDFRKTFMKLGELTCIFPNACHMALSATCTPSNLIHLATSLQYVNYEVVKLNPDRPNIFFEVRKRLPNNRKFDKLDDIISPLASKLKNLLLEFPVTILYMENLEALGYAYKFVAHYLGDAQYAGTPIPENRIFCQFHSHYTTEMKHHIVSELRKESPKVRVFF